ncbi:MAG TPA: 16S rRNA (cytidine(1402)-2'-O)-methyltransferase [Succinivibrionaceae bacterium]|nr:16S rRNA (cytidine(1402)-2'-O)-methyltransferase [Succinivibrionaceae bacterium]
MLKSALYIVPTPIGNLEDITERAVKVLREVTLIAAEDTRHSKILLDRIGEVKARIISCYDQIEEQKASLLIDEIKNGGSVALISDAGTPLINDPGYRVVSICAQAGVEVIPLPGPCALITALEAAALPTDRFEFRGFFPVKRKELEETLTELKNAVGTTVFYEAPRRIVATCELMAEILPDHPVCLCRELTKTFESFYRMQASDLPEFLKADPDRQKGEFVVVIGAAEKRESGIPKEAVDALLELMKTTPLKVAVSVIAKLCGVKKNELYDLGVKLREEQQ